MLYHCPLEPYKSRYTEQLSSWYESRWDAAGLDYDVVSGIRGAFGHPTALSEIKHGAVVDILRRPSQTFAQTETMLRLLCEGKLTSNDTILLDDFWHPGFEALPYAFQLTGIKPKVYAFLWAQSVDEFDFTRKMRPWIEGVEKGFADAMDGIFVACPMLKDLMDSTGRFDMRKVHVVGLPFNSEEVLSRCPIWYRRFGDNLQTLSIENSPVERKNQVVFSSRWDKEKNPDFFLEVALRVHAHRPDVKFVVCTGQTTLRSNEQSLLVSLDFVRQELGDCLEVRENLTKEQYYATLCESKIQFNCASQDWVSFTLLEAAVCGCFPVYPRFRAFPETFLESTYYPSRYLYKFPDAQNTAADQILQVLTRDENWGYSGIKSRSWIYKRFDETWKRQLQVMGLWTNEMQERDPVVYPVPFNRRLVFVQDRIDEGEHA